MSEKLDFLMKLGGVWVKADRMFSTPFGFCHQGAELLSTEGQKVGFFAVFREVDCTKGTKRGPKASMVAEGPLGNRWAPPLDNFPPQVYANRV